MKKIRLSRGLFACVDDCDYPPLNARKWFANPSNPTFYAMRNVPNPGGRSRQKRVMMHREILRAPDGFDVDHIDGNGLNNQKANLRVVSHADNMRAHRRKSPNKTSKFLGVSFFKTRGTWRARATFAGKNYLFGYFPSQEQACKARDLGVSKLGFLPENLTANREGLY